MNSSSCQPVTFRQAGVVNLSGVDGIVQEGQHLLDRGDGVTGVELVEVDAFAAEPAQPSIQ